MILSPIDDDMWYMVHVYVYFSHMTEFSKSGSLLATLNVWTVWYSCELFLAKMESCATIRRHAPCICHMSLLPPSSVYIIP